MIGWWSATGWAWSSHSSRTTRNPTTRTLSSSPLAKNWDITIIVMLMLSFCALKSIWGLQRVCPNSCHFVPVWFGWVGWCRCGRVQPRCKAQCRWWPCGFARASSTCWVWTMGCLHISWCPAAWTNICKWKAFPADLTFSWGPSFQNGRNEGTYWICRLFSGESSPWCMKDDVDAPRREEGWNPSNQQALPQSLLESTQQVRRFASGQCRVTSSHTFQGQSHRDLDTCWDVQVLCPAHIPKKQQKNT